MFVVPVSRVTARAYRQPALNGHSIDAGRALDRLFNDTLERVFNAPSADAATRLPALDLQETEAGYTAQVDLPGFTREDVKVSIDGKHVSIEAAPKKVATTDAPAAPAPEPVSAVRVLVRERSNAAFSRSFTLPVEIDEAASQAKLEHGVLTLTLARKLKPAAQLAID